MKIAVLLHQLIICTIFIMACQLISMEPSKNNASLLTIYAETASLDSEIPEHLWLTPLEKDIFLQAFSNYSIPEIEKMRRQIRDAIVTTQSYDSKREIYSIHYLPCLVLNVFLYKSERSYNLLNEIIHKKIENYIMQEKDRQRSKRMHSNEDAPTIASHIKIENLLIAKNTLANKRIYKGQKGIMCTTRIYQKNEVLRLLDQIKPIIVESPADPKKSNTGFDLFNL